VLLLGAIADDFTGATDLASALSRGGLRTIQTIGDLGTDLLAAERPEAVVVALKTRSIAAREAIEQSFRAADTLRRLGAARFYFKYCSTFDSTSQGNIGPVAEGLREYLGASVVPFVPGYPDNGRRVFRGHLFVGDQLLNESGMQLHPLNPMQDANLVRVLAAQSRSGVGLVNHDTVCRGAPEISRALDACSKAGKPLVIMDSIDNRSLEMIAAAVLDAPLATGGAALGFHIARQLKGRAADTVLSPRPGRSVILAGSCSPRTQEQIAYFGDRGPSLQLPIDRLLRGEDVVADALSWFADQPADIAGLIYTAGASAASQHNADAISIGRKIEDTLATIAKELVRHKVTRLIVAGGETSGAIVQALGISALRIGPEIALGVPWTQVIGAGAAVGLCLALKSGNFGPPSFFSDAFQQLDAGTQSL
jgi:3-dehydrotetronate 4-kinase